jgi:hypothetical protein
MSNDTSEKTCHSKTYDQLQNAIHSVNNLVDSLEKKVQLLEKSTSIPTYHKVEVDKEKVIYRPNKRRRLN